MIVHIFTVMGFSFTFFMTQLNDLTMYCISILSKLIIFGLFPTVQGYSSATSS